MNFQILFTLIAASVGFTAGVWLCLPTALSKPDAIAWTSDPPIKCGEGMASLAIVQSAQYSVGGLLLVVSFALQVVAVLAPTTMLSDLCPAFQSVRVFAVLVVLSTLVSVAAISRLAYVLRKQQIKRQVQKAKEHLEKFPRLTPIP
jgi:heme/copper-type cytochrome/quinol oxidase subunit 1